MAELRRVGVADLGSNSFRLVVFTAHRRGWWKRTDELYETVRVGEGMAATGSLGREPMERALRTVALFAHFRSATALPELRAVATSAIRDASNQAEFLARAALPVEVLSPETEAWYGYVAAVNSTTLSDGAVLEIGGGSLQLVRVENRQATELGSWPLGAVRMTERFLPDPEPTKKQIKKLRAHVAEQLASTSWLAGAGRHVVGVGGSMRNLAAACQKAGGIDFPHVQGESISREGLQGLIAELAKRKPAARAGVPGIKPGRADVILAAALVIDAVLTEAGWDAIEVTEAGLREGVFLAEALAPADPPLLTDVRVASVRNLATQYQDALEHPEHVARLSLALWDALAREGAHGGDPAERELLWAAAMLHDIGMAVDYDDHHKHSQYLVLSAGLPGFSPRELVLLAQMVRYHRKGEPSAGEHAKLLRRDDGALLDRCAAVLRVIEQVERSRERAVRELSVRCVNGRVELELLAPDGNEDDVNLARWGADRAGDLFSRAFGRELRVG